jgi:DNA topoisomerase-1
MSKSLVIVESPAKAKTIGKILGKEYVVKSSKGHVRDLPINRLGVDVDKGFAAEYEVVASRRTVVDELCKAAKDCEAVYLCPDPDREGEAIAWHLKCILEEADAGHVFHRVRYNEITPRAVREAFAHPGEIDMHRVDAQQARRVLDRIVGYKVSPLLWRRIRRGLSAGRVQSVALKLVCDREREIRAFVSEMYWVMGAMARKLTAPQDPFRVRLAKLAGAKAEIKTAEQAETIRRELAGRELCVAAIRNREVTRRAPPPFITSALQQAASNAFGFSPSRTMSLAQRLYEGVDLGDDGPSGLITYMRTDSFNVSNDAREACREFVAGAFGAEYLPEKPNFYKSRSSAQEAHEAIRPTDVRRTPESLRGRIEDPEWKLYSLIWRRFVASQMTPARFDQKTIDVATIAAGVQRDDYLFSATSSDVKFPGFLKATGVPEPQPGREGEGGEEDEQRIPPLDVGERLECVEWLSEMKQTQPPPRFSEASLVRELERNGVGRPSTYASTVGTLNDRKYVIREKRTLAPTELGLKVDDMLRENLAALFDVHFTAQMEGKLDAVERGEVEWPKMLEDFYARFQEWMAAARGPAAGDDNVRRVLAAMETIKEWAPEEVRGKRKYSDRKFVDSVVKQGLDDKRPVSQRQLETLMKIALRYREQAPGIEALVSDLGAAHILTAPDAAGPRESTMKKLALLKSVELDESTTAFVASLRARAEGGRGLSEAQCSALDKVIRRNAARIQGLEGMEAELELGAVPDEGPDTQSGPLLDATKNVTAWKDPVKRGRRVFDDKDFDASLRAQFERSGRLSPKQRAALQRMVFRYRDQVPDFEALAQRHGWTTARRKMADAGE